MWELKAFMWVQALEARGPLQNLVFNNKVDNPVQVDRLPLQYGTVSPGCPALRP
jgi:hypothetical protein